MGPIALDAPDVIARVRATRITQHPTGLHITLLAILLLHLLAEDASVLLGAVHLEEQLPRFRRTSLRNGLAVAVWPQLLRGTPAPSLQLPICRPLAVALIAADYDMSLLFAKASASQLYSFTGRIASKRQSAPSPCSPAGPVRSLFSDA